MVAPGAAIAKSRSAARWFVARHIESHLRADSQAHRGETRQRRLAPFPVHRRGLHGELSQSTLHGGRKPSGLFHHRRASAAGKTVNRELKCTAFDSRSIAHAFAVSAISKGQLVGEWGAFRIRSEEHTSELQSLRHLVCRLLLEKKK